MPDICLHFNLHQPTRIKEVSFFEIGKNNPHDNDALNLEVLNRMVDNCYLKMNSILMKNIKKYDGKFKVSFFISGSLLDQLKKFRPEVIESFKALHETKCVEFVGSTYYNSLSSLYSKKEFLAQLKMHADVYESLWGVRPESFQNTGMIYNNELVATLEANGVEAVLCESLDWHLKGRNSNFIYKAPNVKHIKTLCKNNLLVEHVTKHFDNRNTMNSLLAARKYAKLISDSEGDVVNLFFPYETFGEHFAEATGIFEFVNKLPGELFALGSSFITPTLAARKYKVTGDLDVHVAISEQDMDKGLSAWTGNSMQREAIEKLYSMEDMVLNTCNDEVIHNWRKLQTSDHFYYMNTKDDKDGAARQSSSPYGSSYDGFVYFMNALSDLEVHCQNLLNDK